MLEQKSQSASIQDAGQDLAGLVMLESNLRTAGVKEPGVLAHSTCCAVCMSEVQKQLPQRDAARSSSAHSGPDTWSALVPENASENV